MERDLRVIKLAHFELDRKIGGIPVPTLMLIEGANDSGKSVIAQQIAYGSLVNGYRVRYITTENTVKSLIKQMEALNFKVKEYFISGLFKITTLHVSNISWDENISRKYLKVLYKLIENDSLTDVFIIDSLTYIATHATKEDILEFFSKLRNFVDERSKSVFITLHSHAFDEELLVSTQKTGSFNCLTYSKF